MILNLIVFLRNFNQLMGALGALIELVKREARAKDVKDSIKKAVNTGDTSDLERLLNSKP